MCTLDASRSFRWGNMAENNHKAIPTCTCEECEENPKGATAKLHASINRVVVTLDEKNRRRFVGLLASQHGYGGVQHLARVTGLSRTTILRGRRELEEVKQGGGSRVRTCGGGGKFIEKNSQVC